MKRVYGEGFWRLNHQNICGYPRFILAKWNKVEKHGLVTFVSIHWSHLGVNCLTGLKLRIYTFLQIILKYDLWILGENKNNIIFRKPHDFHSQLSKNFNSYHNRLNSVSAVLYVKACSFFSFICVQNTAIYLRGTLEKYCTELCLKPQNYVKKQSWNGVIYLFGYLLLQRKPIWPTDCHVVENWWKVWRLHHHTC